MTKKEFNKILKVKNAIIILKKESEQSFFEVIFSHVISIFSAIYFLTRKKMDYLILTENNLKLIKRNKVYFNRNFSKIESLNYNGIKSLLEIKDQDKQHSIYLNKFRPTYEESVQIKHALAEFKERSCVR